MAQPRTLLQGMLTKRGGRISNWKTRWMTVDEEGMLRYYKVKDRPCDATKLPKPCGEIDIKHECLDLLLADECPGCDWPMNASASTSFGIETNKGRIYFMFCETPEECQDWMKCLAKLAPALRNRDDRFRMAALAGSLSDLSGSTDSLTHRKPGGGSSAPALSPSGSPHLQQSTATLPIYTQVQKTPKPQLSAAAYTGDLDPLPLVPQSQQKPHPYEEVEPCAAVVLPRMMQKHHVTTPAPTEPPPPLPRYEVVEPFVISGRKPVVAEQTDPLAGWADVPSNGKAGPLPKGPPQPFYTAVVHHKDSATPSASIVYTNVSFKDEPQPKQAVSAAVTGRPSSIVYAEIAVPSHSPKHASEPLPHKYENVKLSQAGPDGRQQWVVRGDGDT